MYHRGRDSNLSNGYDPYSNMNRITPPKQYHNVSSLSPHMHPFTKPTSSRSRSPTISYELPYQLQSPPSGVKQKSPTPKHLQFMSKITEELAVSPTASPATTPKQLKPKTHRHRHSIQHNHNHNHKRICATNGVRIHKKKTRHLSDNIDYDLDDMMNSTSNRSYRKYKTRINKRKHHAASESHDNLTHQYTHRHTETQKHHKNTKTRKKNRAQSTVLYCENIMNRYCDIEDDKSKKSSQDSYVEKMKNKTMENKGRPQTARPPQRSKKHKAKHTRKKDKKHYKSQSHGHRLNFNEGAMDYMSAQQQLLYLYDYTSAEVMTVNRSSASVTSNDSSRSPTCLTPYAVSTSVSNCRNGVNSDAITPRSRTCSSPILTKGGYPIHIPIPTPRHRDILHPPMHNHDLSKYSQLSTRAVRYSPAAHPQRYYDEYHNRNTRSRPEETPLYMVTSEPSLPNLPSPRSRYAQSSHGSRGFGSRTRSHSDNELLFPITPWQMEVESSNRNESTIVIHHAYEDDRDIDIELHDPTLLEIPASLTAEEEGACYLEGEAMHLRSAGHLEEDETTFATTTPLMYRLLVNDKEWKQARPPSHANGSNGIHGIRQQLLRRSKLQCTV